MRHNQDRLIHQFASALTHESHPDKVGEELSNVITSHVAHDALRLVATSPATGLGLGSFSFWHQYDPALNTALALNRYAGGDPSSPVDLARRTIPIGIVGGDDAPSDRLVRKVLAAHGASSELRLLLRNPRGVWGILCLVRGEDRAPFTPEEAHRASKLGPALVAALQAHVTAGPLLPQSPALAPGVIVVGADHKVRSFTPQARAWLQQMWAPDQNGLPDWIATMFPSTLSREVRAGVNGPIGHSLSCAPAVTFGRWVAIDGQMLDDDVAIVIQAARGELLLPSFCDWHGITPRERQVIEFLVKGATIPQLARILDLSRHTINDHLKSVFRKTGAYGRAELLAALTA
ncbi:MAG: helix-turn-helix transcriptional regulator [Corynebacteriales bacterium]|nr:helix-turn-helix transcriptional regulator [Mycobacteriales bacterium]